MEGPNSINIQHQHPTSTCILLSQNKEGDGGRLCECESESASITSPFLFSVIRVEGRGQTPDFLLSFPSFDGQGGGIWKRSKMKTSGSDWDLEEFLRPVVAHDGDERSPSPEELLLWPSEKARACGDGISFADVCGFGFMGHHHRDAITDGQLRGGSQTWSQSHNLTPRHSSISATMESQSSLCTGSPTSSLKPKGLENQAPGCTSGSEQSDDESLEVEAGSCEQGTNISELKRMRRMVSNRESARRSRKKKQARLADLDFQVDELRGENASLYKQLTDANHEFTEAVTDNRVLKSDVEALRVKVKMAEDLVARGSLTCSLDHLLQSQIATPHILNTSNNLCRASEVPPIVDLLAVNLQASEGCHIGASATGQAQDIGMEGGNETKDGNIRMRLNQSSSLQSIASLDNVQSRLSGEITSCGTDFWSWDSPTNVMSKQF